MGKFNIDRPKYHGGQLEGTTVMRLFQNAESIFGEMKQHLINVPTKACDKAEVNDMIKRYIELSTLLDGLFSLARTPSGQASEDICEKTEKTVQAVMVKWRELRLSTNMLKIHGIEDHLVNQMRKFNGIGCFIEDFIEQAHQFGMKDEKRTANMRDRKKAAHSHLSFEVASQNMMLLLKNNQFKLDLGVI